MNPLSRRELLRTAALLGVSSVVLPRVARARAAGQGGRPRMLFQIFLQGGVDALLTTDPKSPGEVDRRVAIPYAESDILARSGTRLGPSLWGLERYLPRAAVVNGVAANTVSHVTGLEQTQQMRRIFPPNGIGLSGTLGALLRGDAPLSDVRFAHKDAYLKLRPAGGRSLLVDWPPASSMLERISALVREPRARQSVVDALSTEVAGCMGSDPCASIDGAAALLKQFPREPLPAAPSVPRDPVPDIPGPSVDFVGPYFSATVLRDALFLLEHRLSPVVFAWLGLWDTHQLNTTRQRGNLAWFRPWLSTLLSELDRRRTPDGVLLSDQVGVVVCSEVGRFPILNDQNGKDHLPEVPVMFFGPGIRPGQYGETDKLMVSTPISLRTGKPSSSPSDVIPTIDDVGATVFHWFGIEDPAALGYLGRRLDFLLA